MVNYRKQRVAEQLQEEISALLLRDLKDPRIGPVTITGVEITPDFSQAWVYFSIIGSEEDKKQSIEGLQSAAGFIRKILGKRLRLRTIPEFNFKYDDSLDRGDKIETLLAEVRKTEGWDDPSRIRGSAMEVAQALREGNSFLISSHVNPDGDAIASMLAIHHLLLSLGKKTILYNSDPVPYNFCFLPGADKIRLDPSDGPFDTTIILDCSDLNRVGKLPDRAQLGRLVSIDHHLTSAPLGDIYYLNPGASSVGEMINQVVQAIPIDTTLDFANCVYCSIMSDTGSFRYSNTTPAALRCASDMVEKGVSPWEMTRNVYESNPPERWYLLALVLETLEINSDHKYASVRIAPEMLEKTGSTTDMTDQFINYPRGIKGVEVAIQFREIDDKTTKVSFRSSSDLNVADIAQKFGGGGHSKAAGCTIIGSPEKTRELVYKAVEHALSG